MRRTKIMATLANDRATTEFVGRLRSRGLDSVRINSAHVDPPTISRMVQIVRSVDPGIKILMDTKGPELRTTALSAPIQLNVGDTIALDSTTTDAPSSARRIFVAVDDLYRYVAVGQEIQFDDGAIAAEIIAIDAPVISARITRSGTLGSRKTVALQSAELPPLPAVSERDKVNILAAKESGIDMIAHSFVRSAADVNAVRSLIENTGIQLFAKIECRQAIDNLDEILQAADGLLVARGDLGTAISICQIPALQYEIAGRCRAAGKPTIVATQILNSMISSPLPTRAEVSDIALGVIEGVDTLLLCGETAIGSYPEECVDTMRQTIESVEQLLWNKI